MYPHERSLVTRLQNKPFAIIGVNSDDSRLSAKNAMNEERLTWRSFFDGNDSHIARQWQIIGFPTVYLIDHKGVIRHKYEGSPDEAVLDREIDQLVEEAETHVSS